MNIKQRFVTQNPCYTNDKKIAVKGLMIHSIGVPQPKASAIIDNWDNKDANVCVHAVLQEDGTVYQILPWNYRAWHCGSGNNGSGNDTHIGVEMTEPSTIQYLGGATFQDLNQKETKAFVLKTYWTAVELFAYLCKQYNLNPEKDGVILSHSEGYKRGIASNHGDVEHIWNRFGLTMKQFRKDIQTLLSKEIVKTTASCNLFKNKETVSIQTTLRKGTEVYLLQDLGNGISEVMYVRDGSSLKGYVYNYVLDKKSVSGFKKKVLKVKHSIFSKKTENKKSVPGEKTKAKTNVLEKVEYITRYDINKSSYMKIRYKRNGIWKSGWIKTK